MWVVYWGVEDKNVDVLGYKSQLKDVWAVRALPSSDVTQLRAGQSDDISLSHWERSTATGVL